jgi:hypothetical protein
MVKSWKLISLPSSRRNSANCRDGRDGARELPLTPLPYVVVYPVKADAVEILHIHHGARTGTDSRVACC